MFYSRLGGYWGQDGDQQTNLWKDWVGLGLGPSESETMPYLVMDAVALQPNKPSVQSGGHPRLPTPIQRAGSNGG